MKFAALLVASMLTVTPCFAQDWSVAQQDPLKPAIESAPKSEDIVINNTAGGQQVKAAEPVLTEKEQKRLVMRKLDQKLDGEYKVLTTKPNRFFHPVKRTDLWIDYHPNTYRKIRTRAIPISEFFLQVAAPFIAKVL